MSNVGGGTTRNRTELFQKYRNQARGISRPLTADRDASPSRSTHRLLEAELATSDEDLSAAERGVVGVSSAMPPQYVKFKEAIRGKMQDIRRNMERLKEKHGRAALTSFDDSNSHEAEIEGLTQAITSLFRDCEKKLQQFAARGVSVSDADEKVKQAVRQTLAIELQKLSVAFRKQQKGYLNKLRAGSGGGAPASSFAFMDEAQRPADDDYDPGFSEIQTLRVDSMQAFAEERDREVRAIMTSINDLAQIMKDLSVLVIDQGTILDRIDYNMDQMAMKVDEGVKQLLKAEKSQKQSRLVLCIMFLAVAVVFLLLVLIFKNIFFR